MIFELRRDIADVLEAIPGEHPRRRILKLLDEAFRLDVHFIARHPTTLFQCLWNRCWWYDCPASGHHYIPPRHGWSGETPPWQRSGPKVSALVERWRDAKEAVSPGFHWVRSLRPLPDGLGNSLHAVFDGHIVTFSPDGKRLASSNSWRGHKDVQVWDVTTGKELVRYSGHEHGPSILAFAPDGMRIVSASDSGQEPSFRVWDSNTGAEYGCAWSEAVRCLAFSPNGELMGTGSDQGGVRLWDTVSCEEILVLQERGNPIIGIAFSADSRRLLTATGMGGVCIWDVVTGKPLEVIPGAERSPEDVGVSLDFIGEEDWPATAEQYPPPGFDWSGEDFIHLTPGWREIASRAVFSPDGRRVAFLLHSVDTRIRVLDLATRQQVSLLTGHTQPTRDAVFWGNDRLVSGGSDRTVRVWDVASGDQLTCYQGHDDEVCSIVLSPDGRYMASGANDAKVRIWDLESSVNGGRLKDHSNGNLRLAISPDGQRIVTGPGELISSSDFSLLVWQTPDGELLGRL
ncbi:MAG TPA: hypothetical protein VH640_25585, partial [Bryobacteraceae bacterium]